MKVLYVEDNLQQAGAVMARFHPSIEVDLARTRDEALTLISQRNYDLAICDLHIPPVAESIGDVDHGIAVLTEMRARHPGTPVVGFTAYKTKEVLTLLFDQQRYGDYLGTLQAQQMLRIMEKDELPEFLTFVDELRTEFETLDQIQIVVGLGHLGFDDLTNRVLRVYARQRGCSIVHVEPLTGGQSGIPVLKLQLERPDGSSGGSAVARVAEVAAVEEERRRFQQRVSGVLPMGSYAEVTGDVHDGAGNLGGVFYQLAENYRALFDVVVANSEQAAAAVARLHEIEGPWRERAPALDVPVRDVRRLLISDDRWAGAMHHCGLDAAMSTALEMVQVPIRRATAHGDLHGDNVLVAAEAALIDFASVADAPTPLDPVSLELSLLFHPHAPNWSGNWPTESQLENWTDFDAYVVDCPFESFVRACREWSASVRRGNIDVDACVYAYTAAQARFDTSDESRLGALMWGVAARLL